MFSRRSTRKTDLQLLTLGVVGGRGVRAHGEQRIAGMLPRHALPLARLSSRARHEAVVRQYPG